MGREFEVVALDPADHPEEGEVAPDFTRPLVTGDHWTDTALSDLTDEGPVCLLFHPMAGAFPATYLWQAVRDRELQTLGVQLLGCTISTPYDLARFVEEHELAPTGARFFADPANGVAAQYGIAHDLDGMAGIAEPRPAAFVIDGERTIRYAWVAEEWPDFPAYDELEEALGRVGIDE